jgi:hypothetical protein
MRRDLRVLLLSGSELRAPFSIESRREIRVPCVSASIDTAA